MDILKILDKALKNNGFTEKRTYVVNSYYKLYRANLGEEKYIFAICDGSARFLFPDIISINIEAKKVDCYKVIIINQMKTPYSENLQSKIKEYGMELWDLDKLVIMSQANKTCNTNQKIKNKSEVYIDSYEPIQYNSENKSTLSKIMKKYIFPIIIVVSIVSAIIGYIVHAIGKTAIAIPFGAVLSGISFSAFLLSGLIYLITYCKKRESGKIGSIFYTVITISACSVIFYTSGYSGIMDLINGPKEIIINDAQIVEKRFFRRVGYTTNYFITGESLNNDNKSIQIRKTDKEEISKKVEKNNKIKVYYFENLNIVYEVN